MTRELYVTGVFYPAVAAGLLWPGLAPLLLAGLASAAFLYCQARILHRARGVPAWRAPLVPWMLFATGLLEGWGAGVILLAGLGGPIPIALHVLGLLLVGLNAVLWRTYIASARDQGIAPLSRQALKAASPWLYGLGHFGVAACIALGLAAPGLSSSIAPIAAGLAAIAGGAFWKFVLIVRASYMQGFSLSHVPQRGSGRRAAPARTQGFVSVPEGSPAVN